MKNTTISVLVAVLALSLGANVVRGADKAGRAQLDDRVQQINELTKKPGMTKAALQGTSTETGVPLEKVKAMHEHYPDIGLGGILVASVLADETKKTPETFLKRRAEGKSWVAMVNDNKVPFEKVNERLDRLEKYLVAGEPGKEKHHKQ